jgi:hypothetical protein
MKYGATSFVKNEGMTSARRTVDLGTSGPTRSRAAERMMTYDTLFMRPARLLAMLGRVESLRYRKARMQPARLNLPQQRQL